MNLAITGPTSGIGAEIVKALAPNCEKVSLFVRNVGKANELIKDIWPVAASGKFDVIYCDLSDLRSVAEAGKYLLNKSETLHVLINNAGGMFAKGRLTKNGLETTFQVNHLGHFLLTKSLIPLLEKTGNTRVINISSEAHRAANPSFENLASLKDYNAFAAYANAKLFNILFTQSIQEKYGHKGINAFSLHPGVVRTNFWEESTGIMKFMLNLARPFMIPPEKGAKTAIYLATSTAVANKGGQYFKKSKTKKTSPKANSKSLKDKLWELSEDLVSTY